MKSLARRIRKYLSNRRPPPSNRELIRIIKAMASNIAVYETYMNEDEAVFEAGRITAKVSGSRTLLDTGATISHIFPSKMDDKVEDMVLQAPAVRELLGYFIRYADEFSKRLTALQEMEQIHVDISNDIK